MLSIVNLTKKTIPKINWSAIKNSVLGKKYDLSVVLADDILMKKLNKIYRNKNKIANTLSFSFDKNSGEIFLNADNPPERLIFLFIHSLLHLKGLRHGIKMEKTEKKYLLHFLNSAKM